MKRNKINRKIAWVFTAMLLSIIFLPIVNAIDYGKNTENDDLGTLSDQFRLEQTLFVGTIDGLDDDGIYINFTTVRVMYIHFYKVRTESGNRSKITIGHSENENFSYFKYIDVFKGAINERFICGVFTSSNLM
jgi:hypothetical protein